MNTMIHRAAILLFVVAFWNTMDAQSAQPTVSLKNRIRPVNLQALYLPCAPEPDQYVPVILEDFDQGALDKWFWKPLLLDFHHAQNGNLTEEYNSENSLFFLPANNGTLRIRVTDTPILAKGIDYEPDLLPFDDNRTNLHNWPFQSGALTSKWAFSQGKYILRCQIPSGPKMWPAFWLTGACADEIDIFEFQSKNGGNHDKKISLSVHSKILPSRCNDSFYSQNTSTANYILGNSMANAMHTYEITWNDFVIRFKIDGQLTRTFYHYYLRGPGNNLYGLPSCSTINSSLNYFEDPQFTDAQMQIVMNAAVRNGASTSDFPQNFDLDYFYLYEPIRCNETKYLNTNQDIASSERAASYGDRSITSGNIVVNPVTPMWVSGPPPDSTYLNGDLLVLTASEEIRILPNFSVFWDGNFVGQISPCSSNKVLEEFEATLLPSMPEPVDLLEDSVVGENSLPEVNQLTSEFVKVKLYPNPARDEVTLQGIEIGDKVIIIDILGHELKNIRATTTPNLSIPLREISSGLYRVLVTRAGKIICSSGLVIEK